MPTATANSVVTIAGVSMTGAATFQDEGGMALEIPVPAGNAGTLTTRTDNETGSLTMASGSHDITTGSTIDLYWSGGQRYGITVGTVSGTTVPIGADDSGTGDNLPTASTAIVADVQKTFNAAIDGDEVSLVAMKMLYTAANETAKSHVSLVDVGDNEIAGYTLTANRLRHWDITGGDTNDLTGNPITDGVVSNGSSTNAGILQLAWAVDPTP